MSTTFNGRAVALALLVIAVAGAASDQDLSVSGLRMESTNTAANSRGNDQILIDEYRRVRSRHR